MPSSDGARLRAGVPALLVIVLALVFAGCSSAPDEPESMVETKNRATRYTEFGNAHFSRGDYSLALRFFDLALQDNVSVDNLPGIAKSYNSIARVYSAAGDLDEATENAGMALVFARLAADPEQEMQGHINKGEIALRGGDETAALAEFERAQEIVNSHEEIANAVLLHNLGTLYARQADFATASRYLEEARRINDEAGDWKELASNHFMMASIASRQGNHQEALTHASTALEYDKRAEFTPGIAADLGALGQISEALDDDEGAYQYYLRALRVYLTLNDGAGTIATLSALEGVAERTGRPDEATEFAAQRTRVEEALR
jgi:tetratricopeptide (TPR) repeat protein